LRVWGFLCGAAYRVHFFGADKTGFAAPQIFNPAWRKAASARRSGDRLFDTVANRTRLSRPAQQIGCLGYSAHKHDSALGGFFRILGEKFRHLGALLLLVEPDSRRNKRMVLLGIVAARVLANARRRRSETVTDLRAHCVALGERDVEEKAEAEAPASCAGREELPAGKDGRIVLDRLRPGTASNGEQSRAAKLCE
jgi:hypothetical protein